MPTKRSGFTNVRICCDCGERIREGDLCGCPAEKARPKARSSTHPLAAIVSERGRTELRFSDDASQPPWLLLEGDVREGLAALATESIDCVVTSPPYFWQRDYGIDGQLGHESSIQEFVTTLRNCFTELRRVLKKDGTFFLNLGDTYYSAKGKPHGKDDKHRGRMLARKHLRAVDGPGLGLPRKSLIGIPWRVALAMQDDGWTLRSDIIWRRRGSLPEPTARDRPWSTHEHVFLFTKSPRYFFDRAGLEGEEDIWNIVSRPDNPGAHFAPFPSALAERCIRCGCRPGGVTLDPFAGSGTTMHVARELGHAAIGIELSSAYCDSIEARMHKQPAPEPARTSNGANGASRPVRTSGDVPKAEEDRAMSVNDEEIRAEEIELEARIREAVRVDPQELERMFSEIPALIAYASERSARATERHLRAKAAVKRLRALLWIEARSDLQTAGEKPTEKLIDATVDADSDKRLQPFLEEEVRAEVEAVRAKGILTALQAKKDALVSIGANLRAELERDPYIREKAAAGRYRTERLPRTPIEGGAINNCALANGEDEEGCQMCEGNCPDKGRFLSEQGPGAPSRVRRNG